MFKKLQKQADLNNSQIGKLFPEYAYEVINKWKSGAQPVPRSVINRLHDFIKSKRFSDTW